MIKRIQEQNIQRWLNKKKAIVVIGPRQVGKTTLVRQITDILDLPMLWLTGDDPENRALLDNISVERLKNVVGQNKIVVIDEAQRLANAGLMLKLITDHIPSVQLLVAGSSSLDLAAQLKESLTGRKFEFPLFPLSFNEMATHHSFAREHALLEQRLLYGYYPEVVNNEPEFAKKVLADLADGLMYKDLLSLDQIKKPSLLVKLLQALALQLGSEVQYNEVAQLIGADPTTVERYIDLLEKSFVIFRLPSLSRNVRNEIKKGRKIYFYDNGIRNAILKNFSPLNLRNDTGALWENFLISERLKKNTYSEHSCNIYFWRTISQQEIDYIEEYDGRFYAYEFKWHPSKNVKIPKSFMDNYPDSAFSTINRSNFESFIVENS